MFQFEASQMEVKIGKITFGGVPGKNPTVLVGTIFYEGHGIVEDWRTGKFDLDKAEDRINRLLELSDRTGNPTIVDIFGGTPEAIKRYIDFVLEVSDMPFFIDSSDSQTLIEGIKHSSEIGASTMAVYNSINYRSKPEELDAIRDSDLGAVVVAATNPYDPTVEGRLEQLSTLIEKVKSVGVDSILVDASMIDAPDLGPGSKAIYEIKNRYGYPSGIGSANFVELWRKKENIDKSVFEYCKTCGILFPVPAGGADFIMYGPIEWAEQVYYVAGLFDAFLGYTLKLEGVLLGDTHPLVKLFMYTP
jgi:tetrahydromethanopterin S-methyltransferase subunit H